MTVMLSICDNLRFVRASSKSVLTVTCVIFDLPDVLDVRHDRDV